MAYRQGHLCPALLWAGRPRPDGPVGPGSGEIASGPLQLTLCCVLLMWVRVNERFVPSSFYMGAHPVKEVHCSPIATKSPHPNWELGSQHIDLGRHPVHHREILPYLPIVLLWGNSNKSNPRKKGFILAHSPRTIRKGRLGSRSLEQLDALHPHSEEW